MLPEPNAGYERDLAWAPIRRRPAGSGRNAPGRERPARRGEG